VRVTIGNETLPIGDMSRLTLNEQRGTARIIGRPLYEMGEVDGRDPGLLLAFLWLAKHRNNRGKYTVERIDRFLAEIEELEIAGAAMEIDTEDDDKEDRADPGPPSQSAPPASANASAPAANDTSGNGGSPTGSEIPRTSSGAPTSSTPSPL
jgi:hypothetical protein